MGTPAKGSVVLVPFPFSDLSQAKLRPAVVMADAGRHDWILWQVTRTGEVGRLRANAFERIRQGVVSMFA